jgi:type IV secretory pathway VirB10-like protein
MRKMILIGSMILLTSAAAAQAGETRGLSVVRTDSTVITAPKPIDTQRTAEITVLPAPVPPAPQPVTAPAPVAATPVATAAPAITAASAPAATEAAAPAQRPTASTSSNSSRRRAGRNVQPRRKHWSEARIVSELHRHGIYW